MFELLVADPGDVAEIVRASTAARRRCRRWWNRAARHRPARCAGARCRRAMPAAPPAGAHRRAWSRRAAPDRRALIWHGWRERACRAPPRAASLRVSPFRTPRALSVSFSAPKASLSARRWPIATSWRITARHCFSLRSLPMPNTVQLVMSELRDLLGQAADQHVDQVHGAETLSGAVGAGQQFLRGDLAVAKLRRRQAVVAIAAIACR